MKSKTMVLLGMLAVSAVAFGATDVKEDFTWHDGLTLPLEGRGFNKTGLPYDRLSADAEGVVPAGVWAQSHHTTGLYFRFVTDANRMVIRWTTENVNITDAFMPKPSLCGIDVYEWKKEDGWRFARNGRVAKNGGNAHELDLGWVPGRPCLIYLPLRSVVKGFSIGIPKGKTITPAAPHRTAKPVVHYGTSIVHGGCCSRPGLAFTAVEGRLADVEVINLGFSGSGRMEMSMCETIAKIDASLYILDCNWNLNLPLLKERCEPFLRTLHRRHPSVPILLCGGCTVSKNPSQMDCYEQELVAKLKAEDPVMWKNLHYLDGVKMLPKDGEATFDFCHPNDYGMMFMGRVYADAILSALK